MTFVQIEFVGFFLVVGVLYGLLPHRGQNLLLVVASLVFAGWVHWWFAALLVGASTVDYLVARGIAARPEWKGPLLAIALSVAAADLVVFKYLDFLIFNVAEVLELLGVSANLHSLGLLLPAGLSFWTFQTVGYVVDVYRGQLAPRRNYVDYLLYVSFFPQLVAGPIERAGALLTQVERPRTLSLDAARSGLTLALWGAFKKVVIADTLAPYVDGIYASEPGAIAAWAGCVGFMVQILADFSGYTDIARGTARILGFELVRNFDHPYLSRSPFELWERWHISLSTWLRDYIYFPVASSPWARRWLRIPFVRESGLVTQSRASLVTMLASGVWHGASWHFVVWGLYWGLLQVGWLVARRKGPRSWHRIEASRWMLVAMLPVHLLAHQLFREPDLADFFGYLVLQPPLAGPQELALAVATLGLALAGAAFLTVVMLLELYVLPRLAGSRALPMLETTWWALAVLGLAVFARADSVDFVYFAF